MIIIKNVLDRTNIRGKDINMSEGKKVNYMQGPLHLKETFHVLDKHIGQGHTLSTG